MNYLAHILLSKNSIEYQLGNLLADPLKGRRWEGASDEHYAGMRMHVAIDVFTDANETISLSKSRLREKGYLKGVVIDMVYDYFLSKHWNKFVDLDLSTFVNEFNHNAIFELDELPYKASSFVELITSNNVLGSYKDFAGLEQAFRRIDKRLSPRILAKETTTSYIPNVIENYSAIEKDFLKFFPVLATMFIEKSETKSSEHFLNEEALLESLNSGMIKRA